MRLAVIPARGGSKRIPRKNIKPFCGKPIIAWSIEAALESGSFDQVIVSTDDAEIADVARQWGAAVPFIRPAELSGDMTPTYPVILHALDWFSALGCPVRHACCIYPTAPLIRTADIKRGYDLLRVSGAPCAFTVTRYPSTIFRALRVDAQGRLGMFWPENYLKRSQDLPEAWFDAGQFYWFDVERFPDDGDVFEVGAIPIELPRWRVQDIDTPEDWRQAELLFHAMAGRRVAGGWEV